MYIVRGYINFNMEKLITEPANFEQICRSKYFKNGNHVTS